ncbi:arylsulfatase A-like enzyme [Prosthecobacter fusiformis]|uniref:Arylsulfatase A-like enzyme n=1 Tax=Prosthecobacter fusiformis TaxID=48464 RepID=A0A4R7RLC1_9BACT|nr:sulfatase-like hydrolase/transferase [Prosthecobacter fusiformis]TDU66141.1 arylsulfatase A-like enzyme [Prosthecobacter fusiformis]
MKALLLSFLVTVSAQAITTEPPNIVLVMADDQGWGDMAYNGHPHLKTPNFDAMAKEGIRFDNFHAAAPVCSPTRGSVLTGRTPNRFGCFSWGYPLRPQEITVAEVLKEAGYRTGHYGKWHLGGVQKASPVSPGASGFDHWISAPNFFDMDPILSDEGTAKQFKGDSSDITAELAIQYIRQQSNQKQRFLAVVWFGSPHSPHRALEEDRTLYADQPKNVQDFYGEITAMDRAFGRIRQELKDLELSENTVLWYCSDNGALPKIGSSGGRRGNKGNIYEGGLLVPALMEWPALFAEPKVITAPCTTSDIFPTVLAMAKVEPEKLHELDGINLLPLLEGTEKKRNRSIGFWERPGKGIPTPSEEWMSDLLAAQADGREPEGENRLFKDAGVIGEPMSVDNFPGHAAWLDGNWKLHRIEDKKGQVEWELYDLSADPTESRVLFAEQPERVPQMQMALEDWLESVARSLNGEDYK